MDNINFTLTSSDSTSEEKIEILKRDLENILENILRRLSDLEG